MNPALDDTGPDSAAVPMSLTIAGEGTTRTVETRGVLAYKPPVNSLGASEWNAWTESPTLAAGERVSGLNTATPAIGFTVLYSARQAGPYFGPGGFSDLTRYQLVAADDGGVAIDFDTVDFDARDFG